MRVALHEAFGLIDGRICRNSEKKLVWAERELKAMGSRPTAQESCQQDKQSSEHCDESPADVPAHDFEAYVTRYQRSLLQYTKYLIGDRFDEAQDVVQETFIKFYEKWKKNGAGDVGNVRAWLFRVAHNCAMDKGRTRARRKRVRRTVREDPTLYDNPEKQLWGGTSMSYDAMETYNIALAELKGLPEEEQNVILLKLVEGATLQEISEITGLKIGTVNYRLQRGLRKLSDKLKEVGAV